MLSHDKECLLAELTLSEYQVKHLRPYTGVFDLVIRECRATMCIRNIEIARLMSHAQQIDTEKLK